MIRLTQNGQDLASNAKTLVLLCRSGTGGNWKKLGEMTVSVFRQINPSKPPTLHKGPAEYHRTGEGLSAQVSPRPRVCPKTVHQPCSLRGHLLSAKTYGNRSNTSLLSSTIKTSVCTHLSRAVSVDGSTRPIFLSSCFRMTRLARDCTSSVASPSPALFAT